MEVKDMIKQDLTYSFIKQNNLAEKENEKNNYIDKLNTELTKMVSIQESLSRVNSIDLNEYMKYHSKLRGFIKKVIRKLTWWYIEPIVVHDNMVNMINNNIFTSLKNIMFILKDIEECNSISSVTVNNKSVKKMENADIVNYSDFENKYRGSEKEIMSRLSRYLVYFKENDNFLDLGCGRGEFIELVQQAKVNAIGIDMNKTFVNECRKKGLKVVRSDLFSYLYTVDNGSLDVISSIQVVEHLSTLQLKKLISLSYEKLKKGGILILETQNPKSVFGLTNNFYIDPTHMRPVHPELLKYLGQEAGFNILKEEYPEYAWVNEGSLPRIEGFEENDSIQELNKKFEYLNNLLYGSTDYDIIFKK